MLDKSRPVQAGGLDHVYALVEEQSDGSSLRDTFSAPNDAEAIARAQDVVEGPRAQLWCGGRLICDWAQPDHPEAVIAVRLRA